MDMSDIIQYKKPPSHDRIDVLTLVTLLGFFIYAFTVTRMYSFLISFFFGFAIMVFSGIVIMSFFVEENIFRATWRNYRRS